MEIPIVGKLFRKSPQEVPEAPSPVQLDRYRPKVRKDAVRDALSRRSTDKKLIEETKKFLREPTEGTFMDLSDEVAETPASRKFIRNGDRVIIAVGGAHVYCALAAGMQEADDAGFIEQKARGDRSLLVTGGSDGLHIGDRNENRQTTIDLLRRLVPSFVFEEKPRPTSKDF